MLQAKIGNHTLGKIQFTNRMKKDLWYELGSSREDLMRPTMQMLKFGALESQTIELDIFPQ